MLTLIGLALFFCAVLALRIGDRLILWPQTGSVPAPSATRLQLAYGTQVLEVWTARTRRDVEPCAFVLRFFGNADRAEPWIAAEAGAYADEALEFWGVNYPGYGGSSGPASLAALVSSAAVAYDALALVAEGRPIVLFGTSLGTAVALGLAASRPVGGLVLHNPPALPELIRGAHGWWNLWLLAGPVSLQIPAGLDSVKNAARVRAPAVFITSEHDEVVPPRFQRLVIGAYAGPKTVFTIPDAGHNAAVPLEIDRRVKLELRAILSPHCAAPGH